MKSKEKRQRNGQNGVLPIALTLLLYCLLPTAYCLSAPPLLDIAPAFGDAYMPSFWQTVNVTVTNPDSGETVQGEIQVAIENRASGQREAAFARAIALPKGAGTARIPVTIYLPDLGGMGRLHLYLTASPDKGGGVITQRAFDRPPLLRGARNLFAVTQTPDALAYLDGKDFDLPPDATPQNRPPSTPWRIVRAADAGNLPDRSAGYDAAQAVYLGPDVSPGAFSDAQAGALRGYVTGGGLLLVSGAKLREDERFRPWIPPLASVGEGKREVGGGRVLAVAADLAEPRFAASPDALNLWKRFLKRELPFSSVGRGASGDEEYGYNSFANSVLHVPGLSAPGAGTIAGFLAAYLLLLVPVNYFILKRLDRREWAWITVPALAALFSMGAFGFSYANKGRQVMVNVAAIAEMGAGSGETLIHAAIGVFSPIRAGYDVAVETPDAVMWQPSVGFGQGGASESSLLFVEREAGGAIARNVAVPMWGISVVAAQTVGVKMGDGVSVQSSRQGDRLSGTVTNRTGRALTNVVIRLVSNGKRLGNLAAGQSLPFAFEMGKRDHLSPETGLESDPGYEAAPSPTLTRRQIAADLSRAASQGFGPEPPPSRLVLTAWAYDRLLPVFVEGKPIANGENVSLVIVTAPKPE